MRELKVELSNALAGLIFTVLILIMASFMLDIAGFKQLAAEAKAWAVGLLIIFITLVLLTSYLGKRK